MGNPKRVLHIVSTMDRGGAETLLMNIYRNIDRNEIQFDFVTHTTNTGDFDDEILSLGGKIYQIPSLGKMGPFRYLKNLITIIAKGNYVAVHSHTDYQGGFAVLAARICGVKRRICHSHSTNWPQNSNVKSALMLRVLKTLIWINATHYCSCSNEAARFLFGDRLVRQKRVEILKNGIDLSQFLKNEDGRDDVIKEFNLPMGALILGHIGRFSESKNHLFLLKIVKKIIEVNPNFILLLVGDGPIKNTIEKEANKLEVINNIHFLGVRKDIPRLMSAFDVFIFPSLFEGFGIVTIEAQCAGTPCIISDSIPRSTDMGLGLVSYLSLEEDLNVWIQAIFNAILIKRPESNIIAKNIIERGFSVQTNLANWVSLYEQYETSQLN